MAEHSIMSRFNDSSIPILKESHLETTLARIKCNLGDLREEAHLQFEMKGRWCNVASVDVLLREDSEIVKKRQFPHLKAPNTPV